MRWLPRAALLLPLVAALGHPALAAEPKLPAVPALLSADRVSYDDELGLVVASGHVEISQDERILIADTVTYNQRTDIVTASGNVSLLEPGGDLIFANFFELTSGLKDGVAQNFRLLMKDKSRFAATGARREGGTLTEMVKGVYSPCELCKQDPERAPLWQVRAARIVHDEEEHEVTYQDAMLEMGGIPIVYLPYFSNPDPTVKRKSGLLTPTYGRSTQLGYLAETPYFWVIDQDKDMTLAPVFTTKAGAVFNGEYRQRWGDGKITLAGSLTDPDAVTSTGAPKSGSQLRGSFKGSGLFNIDDNWRAGFDAQRATDDTYLRIYKVIYTPPTVLPAHGYLEGFYGRSYNSLDAYAFQDVRAAVKIRDLPIVAPIYQVNYVGEPGGHGQRWTVDANAMNLFRPSGVNSRRLSQRTQWELPYTSRIGEVYSLAVSLETDGYLTNSNLDPAAPSALPGTQTATRILPQTKFEWRYPWVRPDGSFQEVIEPRVAFIAGTQGTNGKIPNEDSVDFEFDEQNLFSLNPFPGTDRVDGGERVVYGLNLGAYGNKGGGTSLFVGQRYRLHKDANTFAPGSGLENNLSDIVGRLQIKPMSYLNFVYRFRLAEKDLTPQRTEVSVSAGPSYLTVGASYIDLTQDVPGKGITKITQAGPYMSAQFAEHWRFSANLLRDMRTGAFRNYGTGLTYTDECFTLNATVSRSFGTDRDLTPSTTFLVDLIFKNLGDIRLGGS